MRIIVTARFLFDVPNDTDAEEVAVDLSDAKLVDENGDEVESELLDVATEGAKQVTANTEWADEEE